MDVGQGHSGSGRYDGNSSSSAGGGGGGGATVACAFCGIILEFDLHATQLRNHLVEKHNIRMRFGLNLAAEQILLAQLKFSVCPPSQKQTVPHPSHAHPSQSSETSETSDISDVDRYIVSRKLPGKEKIGAICLLCDKVYSTKGIGRRHFMEQHENVSDGPIRDGDYKCDYCKRSFKNARYLDNHMHREHKVPYQSRKKK